MELIHAVFEHADHAPLLWTMGRGVILLVRMAVRVKRRCSEASPAGSHGRLSCCQPTGTGGCSTCGPRGT